MDCGSECLEAGEMDKWLKALTDFPEDQGSIPRTHVIAENHL